MPRQRRKQSPGGHSLPAERARGEKDDAPKSAVELAMERLRQKDREAGVEDRPLSDEQKSAIAELRKVYEAKAAEREILYHDSLRKTEDPEALAALEEEYRRDGERLASERDRKIEAIRRGER